MEWYDGCMKIGVFDSGIGGEAIATALQVTFPDANIITINDAAHLPYGTKSKEEVESLTITAVQPLISANCDVIVIACNTATALAIDTLRDQYPAQKFIGIEPMVKSAAKLTTNNIVAVCATTATIASGRYKKLKDQFAANITVIEPDCSDWAQLIESNAINRSHIQTVVNDACDQGADVIVLGCTHYHWIKDLIVEIAAGRARVIEPSEAIGRRVLHLLEPR